ncbi:septum formation family protein [Streptomyces sp. NBC_00878]|uniref:septum formation family protein n=1 Tax=Streptomyces sp. NBC_00878 TaxID=2975854 RepID=UPI002251FB10|nr:septum formation family protein [Streptomyces sp. NBC_00878]MCX4906995.1 septum formation family protein [Streptomyces sp. NBC_00878]
MLRRPYAEISEPRPCSGAETLGRAPARPELPLEWTAMWRGVVAAALGVALTLGGVWFAVPHQRSGDGTPYGEVATLTEPLKAGDCVHANWEGTSFTSELGLEVVQCLSGQTSGQVMAMVEAGTAAEAQLTGPKRCEQRTEGTRAKLADVRSYAVVPTWKGFEAAGRRTACLLLGARGEVLYGPLGDYRRLGMVFTDTATMQKGDCLDGVSAESVKLVSCNGPHDEQVLDFFRMSPDTTLAQARNQANEACAKNVPPKAYAYDPKLYKAASWVGQGAWSSGTHIVVCTAIRQDGDVMQRGEP